MLHAEPTGVLFSIIRVEHFLWHRALGTKPEKENNYQTNQKRYSSNWELAAATGSRN
jgi:hypothetical protein